MTQDFFSSYSPKQQEKIVGNAISAYLMFFISLLLLANKSEVIDNSFVKSHIKSAFLIHLLCLIVYIVFVSFGLFASISILGYSLSTILASSLFLLLLATLIFGIYSAYNRKTFHIGDTIQMVSNDKLIDIDGDNKFDERDKITILMAYIPLLGFLNYGKYYKNELIVRATHFNLLITVILLLLYIFGHSNLGNVLGLVYIIFVVFVGINLFTSQKLIQLNVLNKYSPTNKYLLTLTFFQYIKEYFSDNKELSFQQSFNEIVKNSEKLENENQEKLQKLPAGKIPNIFVYFPILNLFFISKKVNGKHFHLKNGKALSLLIILFYAVGHFVGAIPTDIIILFIIPILYGIGYINSRPAYQMPYAYGIYETLFGVFGKSKEFHKKYNVERQVNLKVEK